MIIIITGLALLFGSAGLMMAYVAGNRLDDHEEALGEMFGEVGEHIGNLDARLEHVEGLLGLDQTTVAELSGFDPGYDADGAEPYTDSDDDEVNT